MALPEPKYAPPGLTPPNLTEDPNGDDAVVSDILSILHNNQPVVGCIPGREGGGDFDKNDDNYYSPAGPDLNILRPT